MTFIMMKIFFRLLSNDTKPERSFKSFDSLARHFVAIYPNYNIELPAQNKTFVFVDLCYYSLLLSLFSLFDFYRSRSPEKISYYN